MDFRGSGELVVLTRTEATAALDAYLHNRVALDELVEWADALELRDDVGLEPEAEEELREFLYTLATPAAEGEFTPARARDWRRRLSI